MYKELGTDCPLHMVPVTMLCCSDQALVCYKCLLFGEHRGHKCRDEEETRNFLEKRRKEEEERMMHDILASVDEGKAKIAEKFEEMQKRFKSSIQHEKKKLERQYDLFVDKTILENDILIESFQFQEVKLALQAYQLKPGSIQWPEFKLTLAKVDPLVNEAEVENVREEPREASVITQGRLEEVVSRLDGKHMEDEKEDDGWEEEDDGLEEENDGWEEEDDGLEEEDDGWEEKEEDDGWEEKEEDDGWEEKEEDKSRMVRILSLESPWKIHVRDTRHDKEWEVTRQAITRDGEEAADYRFVQSLKKGEKVLGYVDGKWERVIIKDTEDSSNPKVKLIDVGTTRIVPTRYLRNLSRFLKNFRKYECFSETISLGELEPPPDPEASRKLKQILKVGEVYAFHRSEGLKNVGDFFIEGESNARVSVTELLNQQVSATVRLPGKEVLTSSRSLLSPLLPTHKVFRAKIVHMDHLGVVWVIPNHHIKLLSEVTSLLSNINLKPQEELQPGQLSIIRRDHHLVRGRILKVVGIRVDYINIDSGEKVECKQDDVFRTTSILSKAPLAIPLKPYGVRRTNGQGLNKNTIKRLLLSIPRQQVTICLLDPVDSSNFPLSANIRYSVRGEDDLEGNLAFGLMMSGQAEMITNHREWKKEHQDSDLAWLREDTDLQPYPPPHPFPLAEGLWFSVTVQAVFYPTNPNQFPSINCPNSNRVSCHLHPLNSNLRFNQQQLKINTSSKLSEKPLMALEEAFEEMREQLAADSCLAGRVERERLANGSNVVLECNGEGCRVQVVGMEEQGQITLFFSDYGHPGTSDVAHLRYQQEETILEPLQRRDFFFKMPGNDQELASNISLLEKYYQDSREGKLLAKIEQITMKADSDSDQMEEIYVTFWDARKDMESVYNTLAAKVAEADHRQLLRFWKELSGSEQLSLADQIFALDMPNINKLFKEAQSKKVFEGILERFPSDQIFSSNSSKDDVEGWRKIGMEAIARNEVCALLLSGGQGTRLGADKPKALYDLGLPSRKSLLQIQGEKISRLEALAGGVIPWYIMSSESTDQMIKETLDTSNYFGLDPDQIQVFSQGTFPCLSDEGDILLADQSSVARSSDGNGGLFKALKKEGILTNMETRGVKHVFVYCVDNVLVKVADPVFLGFCISREAECGNKVVRRRPGENVGINGIIDGKPGVVEYSEISEEMKNLVDADGNLVHSLANICVHYFSMEFLSKAVSLEESLPVHLARKKIPHVTEAGSILDPEKPNGVKLEKFVFDVFQFADPARFVVFDCKRDEEFEPLKSAVGSAGTPQTCREKLSRLHARWLLAAGAEVVGPGGESLVGDDGEDDAKFDKEMIVEVSPKVSYAGEGLERLVQGKVLSWPLHLTDNKTYL